MEQDYQQIIALAADNIATLRACDLDRVLINCSDNFPASLTAFVGWLEAKRGEDPMRYQVSPIATASCDSIRDIVIIRTNNIETARHHAEHNSCVYGAAILDTSTGQLDVGFGFGVPCPDFE